MLCKKPIILFALLFNIFSVCQAQPSTGFYQNFEIANGKIYVLHADGSLNIFDENGKSLSKHLPQPGIKLLTKDHEGSIVIADSSNQVKRLGGNNQWVNIASFSRGTLFGLTFNNVNHCFLITSKGILDVITQKTYLPEKKFYHSEWAYMGNNVWESEWGHIEPYMDSDDNIWFEFDHGEWGTDLLVWNTKKFNFIPFSHPITMPFYEANGHLFARAGDDFLMTKQSLMRYDKVYDEKQNVVDFIISEIYNSEKDISYQGAEHRHDQPFNPKKEINLNSYDFYIGAFTFRPSDGKFYVITSEGLLVSDHLNRNTKLGDLQHLKAFAFPKNITIAYEYYDHKRHELKFDNGYPQPITKLQFSSRGDLVMFLPNYGLWLFDGKKLKIIE